MKKEELIQKLNLFAERAERDRGEIPDIHIQAEMALLEFINDPEVTEAWNKIEMWYE